MSRPNPFAKSPGKKVTCLEMLEAILDGDATEEQQEYFREHMDECIPCYKSHAIEMQIKQLIKSKCCGKHVPPDLVERIRNQVNSIS
ncbi:MAG: mycothiol system anti-sigma-R factor [Cyclobacteriaceae bacterium]|nr:mycothiol system anti-sigma-R factor [Cyclobacteriaceae bacterium]MCB9238069.1 mycothiol system anti-sigma-R factor [Flammeovirgaceae bacterium]MCO5272539.1 mycothiol system anti-sigma-R factor [Cyclobacteriaceae bacterium]MCW5901607.1 mycothiol system anti-sigma-R factor [Cyclobacteriaceae bacterium]HPI79408.1 mycothiol system anti-sigma-R factor [Cyclobacteriaceae bacterium]